MNELISQVPALLIILPILTAAIPIVLGIRWSRAGWPIAMVVSIVVFGMALLLFEAVISAPSAFGEPPVVHQLGGFERPIGIELVADELSAAIAVLVSLVAVAVLAYTRRGGPRGSQFYSAYLLLLGGLMGVTLTGDIFNLFVFLEISGIATYALIAKGDGPESAVAALKYLILGTIGASLYLTGVGFVYLATGSLNMIDLATRIPAEAGYDHGLIRAGFAFMFVGFALKVAQWPMHTWQPDAYQRAPDGVSILIAALVSTVAAYALIRITYNVFTVEFLRAIPFVTEIIVVVGSISVIAGAALAVIQRDIKRMFAYSSVSQFGLIVVAIGLVNATALLGAIVHLIGHALMKGGLFLGAGVVATAEGARTVDEYAGLAKRRPVAAAGIATLGITLIGIPPSIGFIGKWLIAVGSVEVGVWPVAVVVFLSTLLTLAYIGRLLEKMYFTPTPEPSATGTRLREAGPGGDSPLATDGGRARASLGMIAILVLAAIAAVLLGFAGNELDMLFEPYISGVMDR